MTDEVWARQLDEAEALQSILGEECVTISGGDSVDSLRKAGPRAVPLSLTITAGDEQHSALITALLPPEYPSVAPALELSCPWVDGSVLTGMTDELRALAIASVAAPGGQECLFEVAQRLGDMLGEEAERQRGQQVSMACTHAPCEQPSHEMVLRIDHMNEPTGYLRALAKWAGQLGVAGVVLHRPAAATGRLSNVMVATRAEESAIAELLHRLRTELVDVNRSGAKCRERQATVLCRRPMPSGSRSSSLVGWRVVECAEEAELEAELECLGLLHVGVGASRFGEGKSRST